MKTILVTGGAGFIGSNFVVYFTEKYPQYRVINLDKFTYAGREENLSECMGRDNHVLVPGDICDVDLVAKLFSYYDIRGVIHFAAESHVDNSITNPGEFVRTNLNGTFNLLERARQFWMEAPGKCKPGFEDCRFHHISTDEVYGTLGETGYFSETTPYAPNSPYSASKAGSDFLVRAYHHTYGLNVTTSNCSNNYGPRQHAEKLIPTIIRKCLAGEAIPVYGTGKNVRDWLFVDDHCRAIDLIFHEGKAGETYNVGGSNEKTNLEIVAAVTSIMDKLVPMSSGSYGKLVEFVTDRPGHDMRYAIDASKIIRELGWKPEGTFETRIGETVSWYLANRDALKK